MPHPRSPENPRCRLGAAKRQGADAADALFVENVSASVSYRLGKLEDVERSESADLGLRVFIGQKVALVSSSDFSDDAIAALPARALAMARLAPEDKFAGLAPAIGWPATIPAPRSGRQEEPAPETLVAAPATPTGAGLPFPASPIPKAAAPAFAQRHCAGHHRRFFRPYAGTSHYRRRRAGGRRHRHGARL